MSQDKGNKGRVNLEELPTLKVGVGDLQVLATLLKSYVNHTRQTVRASPRRNAQLQAVEGIRHRLKTALLTVQSKGEVRIALTDREFEVLGEALAACIKIARVRIPASREREEFLAVIKAMRQDIVRLPHT